MSKEVELLDNDRRMLISPASLGKRWDMTEAQLYNWRRHGRGPRWVKIGNSILYILSDVERLESDSLPTYTTEGEGEV